MSRLAPSPLMFGLVRFVSALSALACGANPLQAHEGGGSAGASVETETSAGEPSIPITQSTCDELDTQQTTHHANDCALPVLPDRDNDGVLDREDSCLDDAEVYNGTDDRDGCPDQGLVSIENHRLLLQGQIVFATDSAEILPQSLPLVDALASVLVGLPSLRLVEVQGHRDVWPRGFESWTRDLSRDRPASIVEALVQRGVERGRLRSLGYADQCLLVPQGSRPERDRNRRIEFYVVVTDQGPTHVEMSCGERRWAIEP